MTEPELYKAVWVHEDTDPNRPEHYTNPVDLHKVVFPLPLGLGEDELKGNAVTRDNCIFVSDPRCARDREPRICRTGIHFSDRCLGTVPYLLNGNELRRLADTGKFRRIRIFRVILKDPDQMYRHGPNDFVTEFARWKGCTSSLALGNPVTAFEWIGEPEKYPDVNLIGISLADGFLHSRPYAAFCEDRGIGERTDDLGDWMFPAHIELKYNIPPDTMDRTFTRLYLTWYDRGRPLMSLSNLDHGHPCEIFRSVVIDDMTVVLMKRSHYDDLVGLADDPLWTTIRAECVGRGANVGVQYLSKKCRRLMDAGYSAAQVFKYLSLPFGSFDPLDTFRPMHSTLMSDVPSYLPWTWRMTLDKLEIADPVQRQDIVERYDLQD